MTSAARRHASRKMEACSSCCVEDSLHFPFDSITMILGSRNVSAAVLTISSRLGSRRSAWGRRSRWYLSRRRQRHDLLLDSRLVAELDLWQSLLLASFVRS
jgi:hypothetical protein